MHRVRLRAVVLLLFLSSQIFLTSCASADNVYEVAKRYEATDEELKLISEGKMDVAFSRGDFDSNLDYYKYLAYVYLTAGNNLISSYAILIMILSVALGVLIWIFSPKSIQLRRIAVFIFILGIPFLTIVFWYGSAILADSFR